MFPVPVPPIQAAVQVADRVWGEQVDGDAETLAAGGRGAGRGFGLAGHRLRLGLWHMLGQPTRLESAQGIERDFSLSTQIVELQVCLCSWTDSYL